MMMAMFAQSGENESGGSTDVYSVIMCGTAAAWILNSSAAVNQKRVPPRRI
jgi:hypothetical protein